MAILGHACNLSPIVMVETFQEEFRLPAWPGVFDLRQSRGVIINLGCRRDKIMDIQTSGSNCINMSELVD